MKRPLLAALLAALLLTILTTYRQLIPTAQAVSSTVVLSQVYGGAGCGTAGCSTYKNDYIELFNRGSSPVSLNGWTVQYAAAAGTAWQTTALTNVTLQPGQYYLVAEGAGANGVNNLPTADATGTIAMSATAAKVALVNTTTALTGACPTGATIVDLVGYGSTANCFETAVAPAPSTTTADVRAGAGCTETDNNSTDFTATTPNPRNTATALNPCGGGGGGTPNLSVSDVSQSEGNSGTTTFTFTVSLSAPAGAGGVTFDIATADGTAQDGTPAGEDTDYVAKSETGRTIAAGASSATFTVSVNGDTATEPNETFFVNVTNVTGANVTDAQGQGTIQNDDVSTTPIYNIQGSGTTSPVVGATVTTTGIVTALKSGSSGGFFIQDPLGDGNVNTSDGIFVFTGATLPAGAVVGNSVQVSATVQEFKPSADPYSPTETELSSVTSTVVLSSGNPLPAPVTLTVADTTAPSGTSNPLDSLEEYEGMRVSVPSMTVVAPTQGTINEPAATVASNGVFYGVVTGYTDGQGHSRPFREAGIAISDPLPAGAPATVTRFDENPERLRVDSDGQPGTTLVDVPAGTVLTNVVGPLDYGFRTYTILPDTTISLPATLPTYTPVPAATNNEFTVASFNMERFFDDTNDPSVGEPVLTTAAYQKRLAKASIVIRNAQRYPDVIGVEEMENLATLQAVAAKVNSDAQTIDGLPNPNYTAYLSEGNDPGGIDVGFLVKASRVNVVDVTQVGKDTTYTEPAGTTDLLNDRPPLVLRATVARAGGSPVAFTVIVNHLRSLNGIDDPADGARVRKKRHDQAEFLANLIQSRQTADPTEKIISVGDYNAFRVSDGYVDLIGTIIGQPTPASQVVLASPDLVNPDLTDLVDTLPPNQQYSYSFDGNIQTLDHALVNQQMMSILTRFAYARDDADFPTKYYEDGTRPERISDHDQPVAYFSLGAATALPGQVIISEFRFRGPGSTAFVPAGARAQKSSPAATRLSTKPTASIADTTPEANNEFIEFYNNTDASITVATSDGSAGWSLVASDGAVRFTIPNGVVIPARGHYLATNSIGYSLGGYPSGNNGSSETSATGDITYSTDIPDKSGIALFNTANAANFAAGNRLDAVGYSGVDQLYREGVGFDANAPTPNETTLNLEYSFYRDMVTGVSQDTNDNVADFRPAEVNAAATTIGSRLGAPGPENLTSPVLRTLQVRSTLLDPQVSSTQSPNRVRKQCSDATVEECAAGRSDFGTLSIRRTFRNSTASNVTRLRFRVVDITTYPSPDAGTADMRVLSSGDISATVTGGGSVPVKGTTLEVPPAQPNGGGWNSSLTAGTITLGTPLAPGAAINIQFLLGVHQTGNFRFIVIVEALP